MPPERRGCRKCVPANNETPWQGPPEPAMGALIDDGERCSGSAGSRRCSRDATIAMTRTMITATAATRGIENQKRFSKVSRDRSRLLTLRSPSLNCRSVSLRRESMRRSTSLFKASTSRLRASIFLFESLCCAPVGPGAGPGGPSPAANHPVGSCLFLLKGLVMLDREAVPPGAAAFRAGPKTGGRRPGTTARVDMGFRKSLD